MLHTWVDFQMVNLFSSCRHEDAILKGIRKKELENMEPNKAAPAKSREEMRNSAKISYLTQLQI
jgi:hypothetical protein